MNKKFHKLFKIAILCALFIDPKILIAIENQKRNFYISTGIGLATYKSAAVESTNTSNATGYRIGLSGGSHRQMHAYVNSETLTTSFEYAQSESTSSITTIFQDSMLGYSFFGYVYLGLVFNATQYTINLRDADHLDAIGYGTGITGGITLPLNKGSSVLIDFVQVSSSATTDSIQGQNGNAQIGPRTDIFLGGVFSVTRELVSARIGYKQRTFDLSVNEINSQEVQTMTWVGFDFNFEF